MKKRLRKSKTTCEVTLRNYFPIFTHSTALWLQNVVNMKNVALRSLQIVFFIIGLSVFSGKEYKFI